MRLLIKILTIIYVIIVITSCRSDKGKNIPDVSHIESDVNIWRFEKEFFNIDSTQISAALDDLSTKHPDFLNVYFDNIVANAENPEETRAEATALFLSSPGLRKLYDTCMIVYPELTDIEKDLSSVFKYYQYYFPDRKVPKVVSYISEYALGTFTLEDHILGLGLDFYLGEAHLGYNPILFPDYIKKTMKKDFVVIKATEALSNYLAGSPSGNKLIDLMIHNGKVLYLMDQLLPYEEDYNLHCYSKPQFEWCEQNEKEMWAHFLSGDLLYSARMRDINKLVNQSPHSPGMPETAPGRTANWIGWKIIESYMKRNPDVEVADLMEIKDAQKILDESKYKPRR